MQVKSLGIRFNQSLLTVAHAIEIMDRYILSNHSSRLTAAASLLIASKFDEIDQNVIKVD